MGCEPRPNRNLCTTSGVFGRTADTFVRSASGSFLATRSGRKRQTCCISSENNGVYGLTKGQFLRFRGHRYQGQEKVKTNFPNPPDRTRVLLASDASGPSFRGAPASPANKRQLVPLIQGRSEAQGLRAHRRAPSPILRWTFQRPTRAPPRVTPYTPASTMRPAVACRLSYRSSVRSFADLPGG